MIFDLLRPWSMCAQAVGRAVGFEIERAAVSLAIRCHPIDFIQVEDVLDIPARSNNRSEWRNLKRDFS
jgi:hypothetical protein